MNDAIGCRRRRRAGPHAPLLAGLLAALVSTAAAAQHEPAPRRLTLREVVATTLARSAEIALADADVDVQAGAVKQAASVFDPRVRATVSGDRISRPLFGNGSTAPSSSMTTGVGYETGIDWRLRRGFVLTPTLSFTGDGVAASPGSNRNTGVASLGLTVPLLRGRGGGLAWASERAAVASLDAARADFSHVRATSVLNAAIAYWGYVVATRTLSVLHESEDRARTLVQQTRTLIEADERPAAESISVTANLAAKRAARLAGEDAVATARQVLAEAMGLPVAELASLAPPVDSFPPTPDSATVTDWPADSTWIVVALRRRADLAAARKRRAATGNLVGATRNEVRSGFDLNVGAGFTGIDVGTGFGRLVSPFEGSAHRGFQTQVGLTYGMPLGNRAGQAQLQRSIAADRQAGIAADELARRIGLAVATSAATVRRTVEQLRLSEMAAALFARAIEAESEKFRLGTSTLFDVIIAQDNLTGARLSLINTQRRYAVAIAQLRFVTGTLVGDPACEPPDLDRIVTTDGGCPR